MLQLKYVFDIPKKSPSVFGTKLLNFSFSCFYFWFSRFLIIEKYLLSMSTNILFDPWFKLSVARRQNSKLFRQKKNVAEKDRFAIKIGMRSWTENCLDIVGWTKRRKKNWQFPVCAAMPIYTFQFTHIHFVVIRCVRFIEF